jgi:hypothetical protein
VEVRRLGIDDFDALEPLIAEYPFKPYRQYRMLSRRRQDLVLRAEIERVFATEGSGVLMARDANGCAAIAFRPLPWDSEFFELSMGRVEYLLRAGEDSRDAMRAVTASCADVCRTNGIRHLSARVDAADMDGIETLERHGYGLKDALLSYFHHPKRPPIEDLREMGLLRPFRAEDTDEVVEIAREAYREFRGRFHFDRHLPTERCNELYVRWAERCCSGQMADIFYVTENSDGRLMGFLAIRKLEPVSTVGDVALYGGGLGACRRESPGAYAGLIRAVIHSAKERGGGAEGQTQSHNFSTVRLYELIGLEYVRAEYTFHVWLGD